HSVIQFALVVALGTLAAGLALALTLRLLPTVRLQLAGLALLAVGLPLAAVILGGLVMFPMHGAVKIPALAAASPSASLTARLPRGRRSPRRSCSARRSDDGSGPSRRRPTSFQLASSRRVRRPARRASSRTSVSLSTRWRATSRHYSTRAVSSWRGPATICAR